MLELQKQISQSLPQYFSSEIVSLHAQNIGELLDSSSHVLEEIIDTDEHPAHFLHLYDGDELLGYLQFGYFAPNGYKPFYFIAHLENLSSQKGVGKRLMYEFLQSHSRIFLDDNAHVNGTRAKGYYKQFGFTQLAETNIWHMGFDEDEKNSLPILYTRTVFGEMRKGKREK